MAITEFGVSVTNSAEDTDRVAVNHTLGAGNGNRIVVISIMMRDGTQDPDVSALTYGGVAATEAIDINNLGDNAYAGVWYVLETDLPGDGVNEALLISTVPSTNTLLIWVTSIQDANQASPEDTGSQERSAASATFDLTTSDGSYQQDAAYSDVHLTALTWGVDQVEQLDLNLDNSRWGVSNKEQPSGGTDTWVVNGGNDEWAYAGASFAGIPDVVVGGAPIFF